METSLQKNPIVYYNTPENFGGYNSVRAKYSKDVVQQLDSSSLINKRGILHLINDEFLFDFSTRYSFINYSFQKILSEFSISQQLSFSIVIESVLSREDFFEFFEKYVDGSRFCVELVDMNNFTVVINPLTITYSFQGASQYSDSNSYELTFSRAKQKQYSFEDLKVISAISSRTVNYAGLTQNEATISLYKNITQSLFDFGYSTQNKIDTIIFQANPANNILHQLADGIYYFFAVNRAFPDFYDVARATLKAGQIEIINLDTDTPQIITDNETTPDEGIIMPE